MRLSVTASALVAAAVATVASGCFPSALDETGKRCSAPATCGDGFYCNGGTCAAVPASAERVNAVHNGDFAEGVGEWATAPSLSALNFEPQGRSSGAARVRPLAPGLERLSLRPAVAVTPESLADAVYCARAWVRGQASAVRIHITEGVTGATAASSEAVVLAPADDWQVLRAEHRAFGGLPLSVELSQQSPGADESLLVDDIALYLAQGAPCENAP